MPHPVCHFEICGKDGKQLQDFYSKLFDWKIDSSSMENYGMVPAEEGGIGGGIMQATGEIPPYLTLYIQVEDLQVYLDKAVSLGGKMAVPPTDIPNIGAFAMFADPAGHILGLFKGKEQ